MLERLEQVLARTAPEVLAAIEPSPGASDQDLAEMSQYLGFVLPSAFRNLYRRHDGPVDPGLAWLWGVEWLNTHEVVDYKDLMDGVLASGAYADYAPDEWWSGGWIPFGDDRSGHRALVLDLHGSYAGPPGQVLLVGAKSPSRTALAPDFATFLDLLVAVFDQERFERAGRGFWFEPGDLHASVCPGYPRNFEPRRA